MTDKYIRREDMLDAFNRAVQDVGILDADDIETVFGMLSSADVAPVVHGRWIDADSHLGYFANCSACGYQMDVHAERGYFNFCPNCGAKMRGEQE